jgi:hypothetical protein
VRQEFLLCDKNFCCVTRIAVRQELVSCD